MNTLLIQQGETKEDEIQRKERIDSIANFMISAKDRDYLSQNGISEEEYIKYSNENSISSTVSFESNKGSNGKRKQKIREMNKTEKDKILNDKKSTKESKLERRKLKLLKRNQTILSIELILFYNYRIKIK